MQPVLVQPVRGWSTKMSSTFQHLKVDRLIPYCYVIAALSLPAALMMIVVVAVYSNLSDAITNGQHRSECRSVDCLQQADTMISWMNRSVEPCQNFYQHACGGFNVRHSRGEHDVYDVQQMLKDYNQKRLLDLLHGRYDSGTLLHKAATLFQSCKASIEQNQGINDFVKLVNDLGGIDLFGTWSPERYSYQRIVAKMKQSLGFMPFFELQLSKNQQLRLLSFEFHHDLFELARLPNYLMKSNDSHDYTLEEQALRHNIKTILQALPSNSSTCNSSILQQQCLDIIVNDIVDIQQQIRDLDGSAPRNISIAELGELFSAINWEEFLSELYGFRFVERDPRVFVFSIKYVEGINRIVNSTDAKKMQHFLMWTLLKRVLPLLGTDFLKMFNHLRTQFSTGNMKTKSVTEGCMETLGQTMPLVTSSLFVHGHIETDNQDSIKNFTSNAMNVFLGQFSMLTSDMLVKYGKVKVSFGPPNQDISLDLLENRYDQLHMNLSSYLHNFMAILEHRDAMIRRELSKDMPDPKVIAAMSTWINPSTTLDLLYIRYTNNLLIPYGAIQTPLYSRQLPASINAAALGSLIMETLFINILTKKSTENYWSFDDIYQPLNYEICINKSFGKINVSTSLTGAVAFSLRFGGAGWIPKLSLPITKHFALKASYRMYRSLRSFGSDVGLPGLTSLDHEQLFFMAFAQARCQNEKPLLTASRGGQMEKIINNLMFNNEAFKHSFKCSSFPSEYRDKRPCQLDELH